MKRGFTLLELMVVTAISSVVIAAVGALYLEFRVDAARGESELSMTRSASLALESIARDAAGAELRSDEHGVTFERGDESVRWEVGQHGLERRANNSVRVIAPRAKRLAVEHAAGGDRFELTSERRLIRGRTTRLVRSGFLGRRR